MCRSSGEPRRRRYGTATFASSTSARSHPTSGRGCRTSCSARTRSSSPVPRRSSASCSSRSSDPCCSCRRWAACSPTSSTAAGSSSSAQLAQLVFSFALAGIALSDHPSKVLIVAAVVAVGIANAVGAPGLNAILPTLVPREDLSGAVALASVQMNLSRVIGPPIGALIYHSLSAAPVFAINALTYLFAVIGLLWAKYARHTNARVAERGLARLLSGVRIARRDPLLSHLLVTLVLVLVLLARVRRPDAGDRRRELRDRAQELAVRRALRLLRPRRRARRGERRHGLRPRVEDQVVAAVVPRVRDHPRGVRAAPLRRDSPIRWPCCSATRTSSRSPPCRHSSNLTS